MFKYLRDQFSLLIIYFYLFLFLLKSIILNSLKKVKQQQLS